MGAVAGAVLIGLVALLNLTDDTHSAPRRSTMSAAPAMPSLVAQATTSVGSAAATPATVQPVAEAKAAEPPRNDEAAPTIARTTTKRTGAKPKPRALIRDAPY